MATCNNNNSNNNNNNNNNNKNNNNNNKDYGYDDRLFLGEIPSYLRCVVCSLVLRDPVMLITCGHKYCSLSYRDLKSYAINNNLQLTCPLDRGVVDETKVHEDVAMTRLIGDLAVPYRLK